MAGLTDKCAITGIGETEYSKNSGKSVAALQMEASLKAIADAGLKPTDIDGVIPYGNMEMVAEDFITNLGLPDLRYSAVTPLGGASAVAAIQASAHWMTRPFRRAASVTSAHTRHRSSS